MIVCSCRAISSNAYSNAQALVERIMQDDYVCGHCQYDVESLVDELSGTVVTKEEN